MELFRHLQAPPKTTAVVRAEPVSIPIRPAPKPAATGFSDFWHIIRHRWVTVVAAAALCGGAAFVLTAPQKKIYQAQTSLEIQGVNENFLHRSDVTPNADLYSTEGYVQTQVDVLESRSLVRRAAEASDFAARFREDGIAALWRGDAPLASNNTEGALKAIYQRLRVRTSPPTRLIRITFDSSDSRLAADFANALAAQYIKHTIEARWADGQNTIQLLSHQMEDLKVRLVEAEERLQEYTRTEGLTFLADDKGTVAEARLRQLEDEYSKAQADRIARESEYQIALSRKPDALPRVLDSLGLADTQKQLVTMRAQLAEMTKTLTPKHYKVQRLQAQIQELEGEVAKGQAAIVGRIRNENDEAGFREKMLQSAYLAQKQIVADEAQKGVRYDLLRHEVDTDRALYDSMLQRVREAGIASAVRTSNVRVIDAAEPPAHPYKPDLAVNTAVGILSGLLIGVVFACAGEKHDRRVRRPGDTQLLSNTRELGVVPMLRRGGQLQVVDSVRSMLPSLVFLGGAGGGPRVIAVTSACPNEGKTTILRNLGEALADVTGRVLLIDADLHRPRLASLSGASNFWGLSNILHDTYPIEDYPAEALGVACSGGLFVLPSGPQCENTTELLYSARLARLLGRLRREFDLILIDTPPLLETPEARILGRLSDGVILVVRSGQTSAEALAECTNKLAEDGSVLLGTVLNGWNARASSYNYRGRRRAAAAG
ncbi:MAG TPA: polysaccharide biosynthesis tyrosine autokinase [Bryobacteraceae bacterium]|nr:polysaccharide biosynthesis tyrosine autokinase [Bryobacteraceae bacterium]